MVSFRQYRWEDYYRIGEVVEPLTEALDSIEVARAGEKYISWTAEAQGEVLGIGGICPIEGEWRLWMMLSVDIDSHKLSIFKGIRQIYRNLSELPFPVYTYVRKGFDKGIRFAEHCGLTRVGEHYYGEPVNQTCWTYSTKGA